MLIVKCATAAGVGLHVDIGLHYVSSLSFYCISFCFSGSRVSLLQIPSANNQEKTLYEEWLENFPDPTNSSRAK